MTAITWDPVGERVYETGIDRGVLYIPDEDGEYTDGVAWNGLVKVNETPTGATPTPYYTDNIKYLTLYSIEEFSATIEAFSYPEEFEQFDGLASPIPGVLVGQQDRLFFGLSYRTVIGNDVLNEAFGYKIHLVYGAMAAPSDKDFTTINETPAPVNFSWSITTDPIAMTELNPMSVMTIDSTRVDAETLVVLEALLYGSESLNPILPLPDQVINILSGNDVDFDLSDIVYDGGTP